MNRLPFELWEARVQRRAAAFPYPPTPDVAARVRQRLEARRTPAAPGRRLAWAAALLLLLLGGLLAVPGVRAELQAFFQIGAIRIFPAPTATPATEPALPAAQVPVTATPAMLPATPTPFMGLVGETTLEAAEARTVMHVRLPTYPADLGPPDRVFLQGLEGEAVILLWMDPADPERVRLSLHQLSEPFWAEKFLEERTHFEETTVNGQPAVWVAGPHLLEVYTSRGQIEWREQRLVEGNVLIWVEFDNTYRLESDLPLAEAVRIAESLR